MRIYRKPGRTNTVRARSGLLNNRSLIYGGNTSAHATQIQGTQTGQIRFTAPVPYTNIHVSEPTTNLGMVAPIVRKGPPSTANEWVERNMRRVQNQAGKWVAVTHRGIIATSTDFDDVFRKAESQGVSNPLVFKVPVPSARRRVISSRKQ